MSPANDNSTEVVWSHVELSAGFVMASAIEDADGIREVTSDVGKFKFFIDVIDIGGCRLNLGDSDDYGTAIRLAEEARQDFEIHFPVKDNVVRAH